MEYPPEYNESDIAWLKEHFEPEYQEEVRRRKSFGCSYYLDGDEAVYKDSTSKELKYNKTKLKSIGDDSLVKLYENFCDYKATSDDLKIKEGTLRKRVQRVRSKLEIMNICPYKLDRLLRS